MGDLTVRRHRCPCFQGSPKLAVLINNAAYAALAQPDGSDVREVWTKMYDVNITSPVIMALLVMDLLKESGDPRVINILSARGSFTRVLSKAHPPITQMAYPASKSALNMGTLEMGVQHPDNLIHAGCPGHCKTGFNNFSGLKDPLDGARVVVELAVADRSTYPNGFYEFEEGAVRKVPF